MRLRVFLCGFIIEAFCFVCLLKMYENPKRGIFLFYCHVVGNLLKLHKTRAGQERTSLSLRCPGEDKETEIYIYIVSARACAYIYIYTSSSSSSRLERERFSSILLLLFLLLKHASAGQSTEKKKNWREISSARERNTERERGGFH